VPPRIDVIVVCWNDKEKIATALDSVFALAKCRADPGFATSSFPTTARPTAAIDFIRERYGARVTIVENGANLGFAAACNRAFARRRRRTCSCSIPMPS
jgi:GT2 family glycosyltransferase